MTIVDNRWFTKCHDTLMAEPLMGPRCPYCTAPAADLVSLFGSQLLLSQYRCIVCGSYFEGLREDRWDLPPVAPASGGLDDDDVSRAEH